MSARLPAYSEQAVSAYQGDVRKVLAELPHASVDCCVTSPPYWGLRDYGIPAQVWGGDPKCVHRWADRDRYDGHPERGVVAFAVPLFGEYLRRSEARAQTSLGSR